MTDHQWFMPELYESDFDAWVAAYRAAHPDPEETG